MKTKNIFFLLVSILFIVKTKAQAPNFPVKATLDATLSGVRSFTNGASYDTIILPLSNDKEFSLEVNAQINSAVGRGLDVEFSNELEKGFRTSLNKTSFNDATSLLNINNLSSSVDNGQAQTYRYVVKDGLVNIYQDGHYLTSSPITAINDPGTATPVYGNDNYIGTWAGYSGDNAGKPTDYGWANPQAESIGLFLTANSGSGIRYMDISSGHTYESDNSTYVGRLMYIRWDNGSIDGSTYSYPVTLKKDNAYNFSWLYEYISNASPGVQMNVSIATSSDGSGAIATKTFTTGNAFKLRRGDMAFTAPADGTYYLTITGDWALFGIGNLSIRSNNIVDTWDGFAYDNQKTPDAYAWNNNYGGIPWNTANSGSGVRYMDVTSGDTYESDGSTFAGRLLYIRWDNVAYQNSTYSFPVDLTGNQDYKFKWIYEYLANSTPGAQINVAISSAQDGTNPIQSKTFTTGAPNVLRVGEMIFKPSTNGTYYITITGDNALFGIGEIQITPYASTKIVIGKNYTSGAVDMVVNSVTFDTTAYAPMEINDISNVDLSVTSDTYVNAYSKSRIILNSSASLYLNNSFSPLINSTVDLNSPDTRLYFENVSPDKVLNSFSNLITIGGTQMENNVNAVVLRYGSGTIIYPHSNSYQPLEVFTEENYGGTSQLYEMVTSYYDLAALDNQIKSFKLKKGYMVTFASNSDGTGYSRVFIAEKEDLNIPVMPPYLYGTVSFIRTMRWHDVGKRGWCGTGNPIDDLQATNSNWFYNWDTGVSSSASIEYVPMRHNLYWPSFNPAYTQEGYTHFLAYNEPDRPDQANMSVQTCIDNWKYFLKSGLRVGSVATSDPFNGYLGNFMAAAEAQNLRVDFIPIHAYWNKSATQWSNDLDWVWNTFHRPVWITEGNKGANWTGNSFPDDPNMLTDANAIHHLNNIKGIIDVLESKDYVERYSLYNWVQDARAFIVNIDDGFKSRNPNWANYEWLKTAPVVYTYNGGTDKRVLTPAGEYYAKHATKIAYNSNREYIPTWTPKVETLSYEVSPTFDSIDLNWTGLNDDLVNKYVIERRLEGETVFTVFKEIADYNTLTTNDQVNTTADYRIKVVGKDNAESAYSNIITFTKETPPEAPTGLMGEATSTTIINLSWTAVDGAGYYIVKRADAIDGTYIIAGTNLTDTSFEDSGLTENTTYYYKVSGYNSGGEGPESPAIAVKTLILQIPGPVTNILAGAGDAQVKFEWDSMYDAQFYIKRSTSQSGPFNTVATLDLGTTAYIDTNITNGTTYYYKLSAFNAAGEGPESGIITAKPNLGQHVYIDFEENNGTFAHDQWGNFSGTLQGTASWIASNTGTAVRFTGPETSFVQLHEGIVEGLNDFTVSVWVYTKSQSNNSRLFDFGNDSTNYMALIPYYGGSQMRYRITTSAGTSEFGINYILPTFRWTNVVYVQEGTTGKIYIDGFLRGFNSNIIYTPAIFGKTTNNFLNHSQNSTDPTLSASMDEFRIYNRALSSSEISGLYSATLDIDNTSLTLTPECKFFSIDNVLNAVNNANQTIDYTLYNVIGQSVSSGKISANGITKMGTYNTGIYIVLMDNNQGGQNSTKVLVK